MVTKLKISQCSMILKKIKTELTVNPFTYGDFRKLKKNFHYIWKVQIVFIC